MGTLERRIITGFFIFITLFYIPVLPVFVVCVYLWIKKPYLKWYYYLILAAALLFMFMLYIHFTEGADMLLMLTAWQMYVYPLVIWFNCHVVTTIWALQSLTTLKIHLSSFFRYGNFPVSIIGFFVYWAIAVYFMQREKKRSWVRN